MKCISLWQPWGTLIAIGAKRIETRSWKTEYRGPIAIHAARRDELEQRLFACSDPCRGVLGAAGLELADLPLGAIVATARLTACAAVGLGTLRGVGRSSGQFLALPVGNERAFGDFTVGRYAWLLDDVVRLARPIPFRGAQGLFDVPDELFANGNDVNDANGANQPRRAGGAA